MPEMQPKPQGRAFEIAVKSLGKSMCETRRKLLEAKTRKHAMEIEKRPGMYICSK